MRERVYRQSIVGELRLLDGPTVGRDLTPLTPVYVLYILTTAKLQDNAAALAQTLVNHFDSTQVNARMLLRLPPQSIRNPHNMNGIPIYVGLEIKIMTVMNRMVTLVLGNSTNLQLVSDTIICKLRSLLTYFTYLLSSFYPFLPGLHYRRNFVFSARLLDNYLWAGLRGCSMHLVTTVRLAGMVRIRHDGLIGVVSPVVPP